MNGSTLVIMAAGLGSRFGGLKQTVDVDGRGHRLMDYSIHDAISVGCSRVVFIIGPTMYPDFCRIMERKWLGRGVEIAFAIQSLDSFTGEFEIPNGRKKPWGTAHAVACLDGMMDSPFVLINADDFYGADAFRKIFSAIQSDSDECYAVGYRLANTLSDNGSVSRGICRGEGGFLKEICEVGGIRRQGREILSDCGLLDPNSIVSMNLWGLTPRVIEECRRAFDRFLKDELMAAPLTAELFLPAVISRMIEQGRLSVRLMGCDSVWLGMTYGEDRTALRRALDALAARGEYPLNF